MARRKRTPEEEARRTKIRELLQASNVCSMEDIQNLFKETDKKTSNQHQPGYRGKDFVHVCERDDDERY